MDGGTLYFCFGYPKSGTTFLQRTLDMHPQVSCPAEQSFTTLARMVDNDSRIYNDALKLIDRRTGGQGAPMWSKHTSDHVFAAIVRALADDFARGKPIRGLNDNHIFQQPKYYDELLERPRMIAIFRNPVDRALSAWRHSSRLAREEPQMAAVHLEVLANPERTLEGFVLKCAADFVSYVNRYLSYAGRRSNFLAVRYEDLVDDKKGELRRIFDFLGADVSDRTLDTIVANSSKEKMASRSARPEFFGLDDSRRAEIAVDRETREKALALAAPALQRLGYDVGTLTKAA